MEQLERSWRTFRQQEEPEHTGGRSKNWGNGGRSYWLLVWENLAVNKREKTSRARRGNSIWQTCVQGRDLCLQHKAEAGEERKWRCLRENNYRSLVLPEWYQTPEVGIPLPQKEDIWLRGEGEKVCTLWARQWHVKKLRPKEERLLAQGHQRTSGPGFQICLAWRHTLSTTLPSTLL